jgi:hypothetical protein
MPLGFWFWLIFVLCIIFTARPWWDAAPAGGSLEAGSGYGYLLQFSDGMLSAPLGMPWSISQYVSRRCPSQW